MSRIRIGEMLVKLGRLDPAQLQAALAHQRQWGGRLGRAIVQLGFLDEPALLEAVGAAARRPVRGDRRPGHPPAACSPSCREKLVRSPARPPARALDEGAAARSWSRSPTPPTSASSTRSRSSTGIAVRPVLAGEADLDRALERHLGIPPPPRAPGGFASRADAIELPEDDVTTARQRAARPGGSTGSTERVRRPRSYPSSLVRLGRDARRRAPRPAAPTGRSAS